MTNFSFVSNWLESPGIQNRDLLMGNLPSIIMNKYLNFNSRTNMKKTVLLKVDYWGDLLSFVLMGNKENPMSTPLNPCTDSCFVVVEC